MRSVEAECLADEYDFGCLLRRLLSCTVPMVSFMLISAAALFSIIRHNVSRSWSSLYASPLLLKVPFTHLTFSLRKHLTHLTLPSLARALPSDMAVIIGCPGITVTVQAANTDLPEYAYTEEDQLPCVSNAYVEVASNVEFTIGVRFDPDEFRYLREHIELEFVLDGKSVGGWSIWSAALVSGRWFTARGICFDADDRCSYRRFLFAELKTCESASSHTLACEHYVRVVLTDATT